MKHLTLLLTALLGLPFSAGAQSSDTTGAGTSTSVQDALYARPFIASAGATSIGGYVEGNTNYFVEDGISEGFSMELRRFNVFLYAAVSPRVKFLSELEFEHGTEEIALETAVLDVQVDPALVLRGGILLPPLGAFNQNHDSPQWDFVERPWVATEIIPSTLSEVGFGIYGKLYLRPVSVTYDLYLTNGLGDGVVSNAEGRTYLPAGKHEELFGEDNNGQPAISGRLAAAHPLGEVGASFYTAVFNSYRVEGEPVDDARRATILAVDYRTVVGDIAVRGEAAWARVDIPPSLEDIFGDRQWGAHVDVVAPIWRPVLWGYDRAVLSLVFRLEALDFNAGTLSATNTRAFDEGWAVVPGLSFRPTGGTVFRANYRRHAWRDLIGNDAVRTGGLQFGFASYF